MKRSTGLAAVLLTASLGLTGCGSSAHNTASGSGGSGGSGSSKDNGTVTTASYKPLSKSSMASAMGAAVLKAKSAHMAMNLGSTAMVSDFDMSSGKPALRATMHIKQGTKQLTLHELLVGGAIYMSSPGMTPAGKYVKIDSSTPGIGAALGAIDSMNPAKMMTSLVKNVTAMTYHGTSTIDGQKVHHYTLTIATKNLLSSLNLGASKELLSQAQAKMPKTVTEEVYLNGDNTTRRVTVEMMGTPMTVDMTKWGEPVHIAAPAKSDLVPLSSLMGSMGGSGSGSTGSGTAAS